MSWARVDDGWWSHPKVIGLSLEARGLWVTTLSWSCHQRRDRVPYRFVAMVAGDTDWERPLRELVAAGLWHEDGDEFVIHDWADYQDKSLSEKRAEAGRKGGIAKAQKQAVSRDDVANPGKADLPEVANGLAGPALPDPTRPDPANVNTAVEPAAVVELFAETSPAKAGPSSKVTAVFDAWRHATDHPRAQLTAERKRRIERALKDYPVADLVDACHGIALSAFHMGDNDRGTIYDGLEVVLKHAANIERFRDLARGDTPTPRQQVPKQLRGIERFLASQGEHA